MKYIMRGLFCFLLLLISFSYSAMAASGDILFEDSFISTAKADLSNTTAQFDTTQGEVRLPEVTGSQSFDVYEDAMIVQNGNLVELYERGPNGRYLKTTDYTDEEALAITFSNQGYAHYILRKTGELYKMEYGSGEYIENPAYMLSGLQSAITITASEEKVFVGSGSQVVRYEEKEAALELIETIDTGFSISQIAAGPNQEIVVSGDNEIHVFRMAENFYVESPAEFLSGAGYGDYDDEEEVAAIAGPDHVAVFKSTGEILNINHTGVIAVKALPGLVYVRDADSITEYAYDGSQLVAVNELSGLNPIEKYYLSPRQYQSKLFSFANPCRRFRILASIDAPGTSSISFFVSSNGVSFVPVENGLVGLPTDVTQLILRAVLNNGGTETITPRLLDVKALDGSLSIDELVTTQIVRNPGGNPSLPTELPVSVVGGYAFDIKVVAPGAEQVWINFSNGESTNLTPTGSYEFTGSHYFPHDIAIGATLTATVFARDDGGNQVSKVFNNHYYIADNIEENLNVFDTK